MICLGTKLVGLAVKFIVDLPSDHGGVRTIVPCYLLHDARAQLLINRGIIIVVPPAPMTVESFRPVTVERLRVFLSKPSGWGGCGRTHDNMDTLFRTQGQKVIKKAKLKKLLLQAQTGSMQTPPCGRPEIPAAFMRSRSCAHSSLGQCSG